jgi:hypothetical protein
MRKPNPGLEVLLAVVVLILAPIWFGVPGLAGIVLYRRYSQRKHHRL